MLRETAQQLMTDNNVSYNLDGRAVSESTGKEKFYVSAASDCSNSLNPTFRKNKDVIEVDVTTLDAAYLEKGRQQEYAATIIKIDVETLEPSVLAGGLGFIGAYKPIIICEVLAGRTEAALMNILKNFDYSYFRFDSSKWVEEETVFGDTLYKIRDWLFVPSVSKGMLLSIINEV